MSEEVSEVLERRRGALVVVRLVRPKFVRKGEVASDTTRATPEAECPVAPASEPTYATPVAPAIAAQGGRALHRGTWLCRFGCRGSASNSARAVGDDQHRTVRGGKAGGPVLDADHELGVKQVGELLRLHAFDVPWRGGADDHMGELVGASGAAAPICPRRTCRGRERPPGPGAGGRLDRRHSRRACEPARVLC